MSTAMSRLNAFLDSELEQLLCFDTEIDAEDFCRQKSAIFVIMPEEDPNKFFMVSLIIQQLYREILSVADENGGQLKNRCVFFCDEFGTLPKIESAEMMFSASRSRRLQIVPIIQSFAQLEKNYGKEGADVIVDNTQLTIFGGFAPNSTSAETLSKSSRQQDSNLRFGQQEQGQSFSIFADDRTPAYDSRRTQEPSKRHIRCYENSAPSDEGKAETVLQVGNYFWRAVHIHGERKPQSALRKQTVTNSRCA